MTMALMGHSGGGMFASYALFARPGAFRRYIIGSPSSNAADRAAFRLEAEYAAANTDLEGGRLFRRGREGDRQAQSRRLGNRQRSGPDGRDTAAAPVPIAQESPRRIFPGKDHSSVMADVIAEGIRAVWADALDGARARARDRLRRVRGRLPIRTRTRPESGRVWRRRGSLRRSIPLAGGRRRTAMSSLGKRRRTR